MHNIENKCKKFKNASKFIYFAKSSLQNMISCSAPMDCSCERVRLGNRYRRIARIARIAIVAEVHGWSGCEVVIVSKQASINAFNK